MQDFYHQQYEPYAQVLDPKPYICAPPKSHTCTLRLMVYILHFP